MKKILLRFDDVCPTMNWEQFEEAIELLKNRNLTALLGVVPDCQDPDLDINPARQDFWNYLKDLQQQGFTIAMHGYQHVFSIKANGIVTKNKISEFAGLSYEEQLSKIRAGKAILNAHGIETDVFFAPAHSYDDNTLRALAACGFHYISDGASCRPYMRQGIVCLPCRNGGIPTIKGDGFYTAVIHAHEWVNPQRVSEWVKFNNLCNVYSEYIVDFNVFSRWPKGPTLCQRTNELLYLYFQNVIVPVLVKVRRVIKKH